MRKFTKVGRNHSRLNAVRNDLLVAAYQATLAKAKGFGVTIDRASAASAIVSSRSLRSRSVRLSPLTTPNESPCSRKNN